MTIHGGDDHALQPKGVHASNQQAPIQCGMCGGPAAYSRKYSGQTLCVPCFKNSIEKKVAKTISKYDMIQNNETVAVAVSGGKDSLALLQIIHGMSQRHNFEISVITVDEGIPGYRDEALGLVSGVCDTMGLPHRVYSYSDLFDVTLDAALKMRSQPAGSKAPNLSSCSICGTLRRRAIDIAARDVGADVVATGHNLDDMLQTFMINMLSGDTDKIAWMSPGGRTGDTGKGHGPRRIKPFCEIYESEIVYYAFASSLPFQQEPCPHMNEGIRTEIREFLNSLESERSGIKNSMYASVARMIRMAHDAASGHKQSNDPDVERSGSVMPGMAQAADAVFAKPAAPAIPAPGAFSGGRKTVSNTKQRMSCVRCGAACTGNGVCSVCGIMAGLGMDWA